MGKQSKRRAKMHTKGPSVCGPCAPTILSETTHPFYESDFLPIRSIPVHVQRSEHGYVFARLLEEGVLTSWSLGRKGTHISSKFVTDMGTTDYLTSPFANDDDYLSLARAHAGRALEVMEEEAHERTQLFQTSSEIASAPC